MFAKSCMFLTMLFEADCNPKTTVFAKSCPGRVIGLEGMSVGGYAVGLDGIWGVGIRGIPQYHHQAGFGVMIVPGGKLVFSCSSNFWSDRSQSMFWFNASPLSSGVWAPVTCFQAVSTIDL